MKVRTIFLVNMFPKLNIVGGLLMKTFQNSQEFRFNANVLDSVVVYVMSVTYRYLFLVIISLSKQSNWETKLPSQPTNVHKHIY